MELELTRSSKGYVTFTVPCIILQKHHIRFHVSVERERDREKTMVMKE